MLDATLYAPVGLLVAREQTFEGLAKAGRKQLAFSRSLGRAALQGIAKGMKPAAEASGKAAAKPAESTNSSASATSPVTVKAPAPAGKAPVAGYDKMTARDLITLISSCSDDEAAWIRQQESTTKKRVTVLRALDARPPAS